MYNISLKPTKLENAAVKIQELCFSSSVEVNIKVGRRLHKIKPREQFE